LSVDSHTIRCLLWPTKVVDAVKSGAIKRFVVMAGCDGRHASRKYYTGVADEAARGYGDFDGRLR